MAKSSMKFVKLDASALLAEKDVSRAWAPPPEFVAALDPILIANMSREGCQRVGSPRVTEWLNAHGCKVGESSVARWMSRRTTELKKDAKK